jgi:hypothetical protein
MPQLWEWFCDARRDLIIDVIVFLAGGPLIAVGILDGYIDGVLVGLCAIIASSFAIWKEWSYFSRQQRRPRCRGRQDAWIENDISTKASPVPDPEYPDEGPKFSYNIDSGTPASPIRFAIPFLIFYLIYILYSAKHFIAAAVVALDSLAIVFVLCLLVIAYVKAK